MASHSSSSFSALYVHFSPRSLSRPNQTPTPKTLNLKSRHHPPPLSSVPGGSATTFTRLPPKPDFSSLQLNPPPEIKLYDTILTENTPISRNANAPISKTQNANASKSKTQNANDPKSKTHIQNNPLSTPNEESEEKFELFVVNSDSEYETDDDFVGEYDNENLLRFRGEGFDDIDNENKEFEEGGGEKQKGVPAVMRCFDRAKIYVKAGDGGNGVVAFRREKYVPMGGPSGGDGGRGGNVYVEVDGSMNSLLPFRQSVHFRAGRGGHGQGKKQSGAKGEDVVVSVPPGTVVRDGEQGDVVLELLRDGERGLLLPGGRGGRGNAAFKSGTNKVPKIAENGEEGPEMWLELELKLVADVGIVGAPNAGKSTYLSVISAAQPSIANYPFTTLLPNLGVVSFDYDATVVVADLPGLLEGAHRGFGLGHEFLRHAERCSVLVHVVDGSSQQPEYEFDAVRLELEMFNPELAQKPYLVAYNKMDLPEAYENWISFKEKLCDRGIEPFCMSAVKRDGTQEIICAAYELVRKISEANKEESWNGPLNLNHVADMVRKQQSAPINEFEISHDSATNTWHVDGAGLQRFVQMTNWSYVDSDKRFQRVLEACGVYKSLIKLGVKEGDTVTVGEMEMEWHDSPGNSHPANMRK